MRIKKKLNIILLVLVILFLSTGLLTSQNESDKYEKLYWNADFAEIARIFENMDFGSLNDHEKLLYIECLARTGKGTLAKLKLESLDRNQFPAADYLAISGLVELSLGNLDGSEKKLNNALKMNKQCKKAILGKVLLFLYRQHYSEAENWFERYLEQHPTRGFSHYVYLLGTEVFSASRNAKKMVEFYSKQGKLAKKDKKSSYKNLKANSRLYKKIRSRTQFDVKTEKGSVSIPFMEMSTNTHHFLISLHVKNKDYKVLLDTGNATGWIIHNRMLLEKLQIYRGGRTTAIIGTEAEGLDGYHILTRRVTFNDFRIENLKGLYVPKPHPDFFDANLNPVFIRNRVVTIDCINKKLVFRKKETFDRDISAIPSQNLIRLPWYGYKRAFLPVSVNRKKRGLGLIETGAEDISIKLDFTRGMDLKLKSRFKYLSNGKVYRFFETPIKVFLGDFLFERKNAEVWSFDRFYNRISGLTADIILGPLVFVEKFSISFDPISNEIVIVSDHLRSSQN